MKMTTLRGTAIALAGLVGVIALVAASASGASGTKKGVEHFTFTDKTIGQKPGPVRVVATGPIHGAGTVQLKSSANNRVDHDTLRLARGSIHLVATEKSFAVHPNLPKCTATTIGHGVFTVTGGTGAFRGVRGHGTYHRRTILTGARDASGKCLGNSAPPSAVKDNVVLTGKVSLP
jgi:hypothetical protein